MLFVKAFFLSKKKKEIFFYQTSMNGGYIQNVRRRFQLIKNKIITKTKIIVLKIIVAWDKIFHSNNESNKMSTSNKINKHLTIKERERERNK